MDIGKQLTSMLYDLAADIGIQTHELLVEILFDDVPPTKVASVQINFPHGSAHGNPEDIIAAMEASTSSESLWDVCQDRRLAILD